MNCREIKCCARVARLAIAANRTQDAGDCSVVLFLIGAPDDCGEPLPGVADDGAADSVAVAGGAATFDATGLATVVTVRIGGLIDGAAAGLLICAGFCAATLSGRGGTRTAAFVATLACAFSGPGAGLAATLATGPTVSRHKAIPPSSPSSLLMVLTPAGSLKFTSRLLPPPIYNRS